jgi:hypothetical protein
MGLKNRRESVQSAAKIIRVLAVKYIPHPTCNSFPQPIIQTLTPALVSGESETADFADPKKKSTFVCVHQRPPKGKMGVAHQGFILHPSALLLLTTV